MSGSRCNVSLVAHQSPTMKLSFPTVQDVIQLVSHVMDHPHPTVSLVILQDTCTKANVYLLMSAHHSLIQKMLEEFVITVTSYAQHAQDPTHMNVPHVFHPTSSIRIMNVISLATPILTLTLSIDNVWYVHQSVMAVLVALTTTVLNVL
jgi:hypothetical protein